jgi:hypothetical protein
MYNLADWRLGVKLTSYLCVPASMEADFQIQVLYLDAEGLCIEHLFCLGCCVLIFVYHTITYYCSELSLLKSTEFLVVRITDNIT